jgi:hypothetical protein
MAVDASGIPLGAVSAPAKAATPRSSLEESEGDYFRVREALYGLVAVSGAGVEVA